MKAPLRGLYVITDDRRQGADALTTAVAAALEGGARVVQYRDKSTDQVRRLAEATALSDLCRRRGVPMLVNDDVELALAAGADGVHLGRDDAHIASARRRLGNQALIGVSCYNHFALARQAVDAGADYVAFGSFFASPTKPQAVAAGLDLLAHARDQLAVPVVAIGGISPENGGALVKAGADMLAVISAVFAATDITAATRAFKSCFDAAQEGYP